ncbi:putative Iron-sulfur clusters transporter ATM1 [Streptomyces alboflavus]|uniref:Putative Iron-sulfur clusters transporter ATM1 n=1 Tax=Streptomyces alboflavus TaxID=67267 RepID=A0A1Z1WSB9_9ACTN|nr:hypothetical protein [Streptomyces alboflavus]ARX89351.1 putative Iron-sulfur clusters transporter ATM1 [Streptomyces alboflavus]
MVDGTSGDDRAQLVRGGLLLLVVTVFVHQAAAIATDVRLVLQHRIGLEFDRRLMNLCSSPAHIGHYQDPDFLDTAEVVRQRRGEFGTGFAALVENANLVARCVGALVLLAFPPAARPAAAHHRAAGLREPLAGPPGRGGGTGGRSGRPPPHDPVLPGHRPRPGPRGTPVPAGR